MAPAWLPLDVTLAAAEAAARRGVSAVARSPGQFLDQYEGAQGDPDRLDPYWRRRRDAFVARHRAQLLSTDTHREGWDDKGQPTRRHLALAVWAWSPTPGRLRRWLEGQVKSNPETSMLPPAPPHSCVTLELVLALAKRDGFDVTYSRDSRDGRIPRDSAVVVSRFIRGRGTEQVAHYRAATSGYEQRPEHVELSFQRGYFLNRFHPSDGGFSLNGRIREEAEGTPMDDLSTRWAAFYGDRGGRELIEAQDAFQREQEEHAEQTARAMHEPMVALRARQEAGEVGGIKVARSTGRVRAPRQPREPVPAPVQTSAERLIHALRAREGSVIDRGVRVIGPNRFKSYFDALRGAWAELGGEPADLEAEMHRGEIEVLTEEAGLGSRAGRGVGGNRHATLIEYVVHPDLRLTSARRNSSAHPAIYTAWELLRRMAPRALRPWPHLRVTPEPGRASARAHAWCVEPRGGRCTVEVAPKLEDRAFKSICGVLAHELGHAYLLQAGATEHSERDADDAAELLFGHVIRYDADEVQTWGSGQSPRPAHLPR